MINSRLFAWIFLLVSSVAHGDELKPFTTDGCSVFPDGTIKQQSLWVSCCIRHDLAYWKGGTFEERQQADQALEQCVIDIGRPEIASIMHMGVRVGGSPFFPTSYRWGYGWSYLRGYKPLSEEEKKLIGQRLDEFRLLILGLADEINLKPTLKE